MNNEINPSPCVATVGFFDGVHVGHRFLIEELKALAREKNMKSVIVTFPIHPRKVLNSDFQPELLTSFSEKIAQLICTEVGSCIVLDFTEEMAQMSAFEFLKKVLKEQLNVKALLVGHDHRFGHNRADGFPEYKNYGEMLGMEVILAQRFVTDEDQHISSSTIRHALQCGDIEHANRLLTYGYSLQGKVVEGFKVGREIGFPTANLKLTDAGKLVPAHGVYAAKVTWNGQVYKAMMNIGTRPTLNNGFHTSIEVHILDFTEDIYNQIITVEFVRKIRDEKKFNGVDELIEQLKNDKQAVRKMN